MKRIYSLLPVLMIGCFILSCSDKDDNTKTTATNFDIQKARAFIDSINAKWVEELKKGDSVAIASHYGPDAKILLSNGEPITGSNILSMWGGMIRAGMRDCKFVTTD